MARWGGGMTLHVGVAVAYAEPGEDPEEVARRCLGTFPHGRECRRDWTASRKHLIEVIEMSEGELPRDEILDAWARCGELGTPVAVVHGWWL